MLTASLALGVVVGLILFHLTGLSAGGIITPGYLALALDRPLELGAMLAVALLTCGIIRLLADPLMLYGARRFGLTVLVGLAVATGARLGAAHAPALAMDWNALGYVVPGLIAHQFDRQGIVLTLVMLAIAVPLVRALLVVAARW